MKITKTFICKQASRTIKIEFGNTFIEIRYYLKPFLLHVRLKGHKGIQLIHG